MKKEVIPFTVIYIVAFVLTMLIPRIVGERVISYLGADGVIYGSPVLAGDQSVTEVVRFVMTPVQTGCTMVFTVLICVIIAIITRFVINKVWGVTDNIADQGEADALDIEVIENDRV